MFQRCPPIGIAAVDTIWSRLSWAKVSFAAGSVIDYASAWANRSRQSELRPERCRPLHFFGAPARRMPVQLRSPLFRRQEHKIMSHRYFEDFVPASSGLGQPLPSRLPRASTGLPQTAESLGELRRPSALHSAADATATWLNGRVGPKADVHPREPLKITGALLRVATSPVASPTSMLDIM